MGKIVETHTPGPWRVRGTNFGYTNCDVLGPPHPDGGDYAPICRANSEANARLIAAAPELLAACKELVQSLEVEEKRSGIVCFGFEAAKAAILKTKRPIDEPDDAVLERHAGVDKPEVWTTFDIKTIGDGSYEVLYRSNDDNDDGVDDGEVAEFRYHLTNIQQAQALTGLSRTGDYGQPVTVTLDGKQI